VCVCVYIYIYIYIYIYMFSFLMSALLVDDDTRTHRTSLLCIMGQ